MTPAANLAGPLSMDTVQQMHETSQRLAGDVARCLLGPDGEQMEAPLDPFDTTCLAAPVLLSLTATSFSNAQAASNVIQQAWSPYRPLRGSDPLGDAAHDWWRAVMGITAAELVRANALHCTLTPQKLAKVINSLSCRQAGGTTAVGSSSTTPVRSAHTALQQWWLDMKMDNGENVNRAASGKPQAHQVHALSAHGVRIVQLCKALDRFEWRLPGSPPPEEPSTPQMKRTRGWRLHPTTSSLRLPPQYVTGNWTLHISPDLSHDEIAALLQASAVSDNPALHLKAIACLVYLELQHLQQPGVLLARMQSLQHMFAAASVIWPQLHDGGSLGSEGDMHVATETDIDAELEKISKHEDDFGEKALQRALECISLSEESMKHDAHLIQSSQLLQSLQRYTAKFKDRAGDQAREEAHTPTSSLTGDLDMSHLHEGGADAPPPAVHDPWLDDDENSCETEAGWLHGGGAAVDEPADSSDSSDACFEGCSTPPSPFRRHAVMRGDGTVDILEGPPPAGDAKPPAASGHGGSSPAWRNRISAGNAVAHSLLREHMQTTPEVWGGYDGGVSEDDSE